MIYAYDKTYLEDARRALARMLDYAVNDLKFDISEFYYYFLSSNISEQFENGNTSVIVGRSGTEIAYMVIEENNINIECIKPKYTVNRSEEYWTGYALAYFQWRTGLSFKDINKYIPIERIQKLYNPYHEMDIRQFYDRMVSIYMEEKPDTNLKSLRKRAKLSQKELSEITDIPIRTIQQYEQRQKDINKASMEYVYKLSKALMCEPKDLMEFVNKG